MAKKFRRKEPWEKDGWLIGQSILLIGIAVILLVKGVDLRKIRRY